MATASIHFSSAALQKDVTYTAIIPEQGAGPFPVLLLLHGHRDDHTAWLYNTKLGFYARSQAMIIIMPDGGTSFYLDLDEPGGFRKWHGQQYESFIIQDLWQHVHNTFHVQPERWAIEGNSMGGYGALRLGCKYPERFSSVWAHSGRFFNAAELEEVVPDPQDADVFATVERLAHSDQRIELTIDCGTEDVLLEQNRAMHQHMERLGLTHRYIERAGAHNWSYWDEQLPLALQQHARVLQEQRQQMPE